MSTDPTTTSNPTGPTSSLESLASQLLQEVGECEESQSTTNNVLDRMDLWLGITDSDDPMSLSLTVEDCAPFSSSIYERVSKMLQESWNPSTTALPNSNVFIQELHRLQAQGITKNEDLIASLHLSCIPAVRVTQWIRQWMEYNVEAPDLSSTESTAKSFSHYLLLSGSAQALMQALFVHMTLLPTFQSQLLLFNQAFQRGDFSEEQPKNKNLLGTARVLTDPTERLHHYQLAQQLAQQLLGEYQAHLQRLETILGDWYATSPTLRPLARAGLSRVWRTFCLSNASGSAAGGISLRGENTTAAGLDVTLRVLYRILLGLQEGSSCSSSVLEELLFDQLLPLHQPNAMVLWRDQTSLLELYHVPLVQCMAYILKQQPQWIPSVCQALLLPSESIWPLGGNTPKQVLLLHEVDTFLGLLGKDAVMEESAFISILKSVAQCMASEHSRLAERALTLMRNDVFQHCIQEVHLEASLRVLLPALTRSTKTGDSLGQTNAVPWNPTVRKMTFHVLKNLQAHNPSVFATVCNQLFGNAVAPLPEAKSEAEAPKKSSILYTTSAEPSKPPAAFNQRFSLQAGMGDWRPPPSNNNNKSKSSSMGRHTNMPPPSARPPRGGAGAANPPSTITGVAPWANNKSPRGTNPPSTITGVAPWAQNNLSSSNGNPPSTITGVAPWAQSKPPPPPKPSKTNPPGRGAAPWATGRLPPSRPPPPATTNSKQILPPLSSSTPPQPTPTTAGPTAKSLLPPPITEDKEEEEEEEEMEEKEDTPTDDNSNPGLAHVLRYMEQCKPPGMDEDEDEHASSAWSKAQMAETPTLLPDLKFHDLVFGQELGQGAFGVVKYARLIDRTKTRSHWAEYAVKVIATERMKEFGYEYSVAREIASLHLISHPNVARLVSSFRFQQGAYLVLEYASGGDLHQLLQQHGSLDVPSCQFVLGEIVAALASLHDDGFLYGDLKPENVVISETGHIKLTDFGACRPYTDRAKSQLQRQMGKSGKNLLDTLREGDPRKFNKQGKEPKDSLWGVAEEDENEEAEDSGWMASNEDDSSKQKEESESKLINDDTMEVVDNNEHDTHKEDLRIEGTTAYLPPEVVMGSIPTPAADSWALGCVLYQCLSGRPPILEADESQTRSKIVHFDGDRTESDSLFGPDQKHAADIPDHAKSLIRSLLDRVAHNRPSMPQTAQHDFFEGQDVMRLYQNPAYPLDVGGVAPAPPDAQWSRRQFSSIWAPQPQAYDISGTATTANNASSSSELSAPIPEGDEAGAPFTSSQFYRVAAVPSNATKAASSTCATVNGGDLAQQPLCQIEEDDVSMASSTDEKMVH